MERFDSLFDGKLRRYIPEQIPLPVLHASTDYSSPHNSITTMYRVVRIPLNSARTSDFIQKFRAAKLAALVAEPTSFATRHAEEILLPTSTWEQRLGAPAATFICVKIAEDQVGAEEEDILQSNDWVGMVSIRGPLAFSDFYIPATGQPRPGDPDQEIYWHMATLYVSGDHRNRGLAKNLIITAMDHARQQAVLNERSERIKQARIRLFCDPGKQLVVRMYSNLGFSEAGRNTMREAFEANGDKELVPKDTSSSDVLNKRWETRFGLSMEKVVDVL